MRINTLEGCETRDAPRKKADRVKARRLKKARPRADL